VLLILTVSAYQYIQSRIQYLFYRPVEVTRGPWQVLDPGRPVDDPRRFEVVQEGTGTMVEPGDLIWVSMWFWSPERNEIEQRNDDWWIWVGFRTEKDTPFHSINPKLLSAFVGMKEGGVRFFEPSYKSGIYTGEVYVNPFGSYSYYSREKYINKSRYIYISPNPQSGYTIVHIKKVFKGQLKYRTTYLYDGTWFLRCRWFMTCEYVNTPRENWMDDARYAGVSADGRRATFQYGPVATPGKGWAGGMRGWDQNEWQKLPKGVQVE
jgi:hypothetical protein